MWIDSHLRLLQVDPEWTVDLYNSYTRTVDAFAKYDNVLAFGVGSEVMIDKGSLAAYFHPTQVIWGP